MMKQFNMLNTMYCFQQLKAEINTIRKAIESKEFYSLEIYFMDEAEVLQFLKISRSTLYKYKKIYNLEAIPLFGRNMYCKHHIIEIIVDQLIK